jgi:hypothetical protein
MLRKESHIKDLMLIMHMFLQITWIYSLRLSILWILDGKLILVKCKNIMQAMALIVKKRKKM